MPEATFEVQVSFRESDRSRLLEAVAIDSAGRPVEGLNLSVEVDERGTLHIEDELRHRDVETGAGGSIYFSWWPWPRFGPPRNYFSTITVRSERDDVRLFIEDLFE